MSHSENLPDVLKKLTVALYESNGTPNAVALRREMVKLPVVADSLNSVEKMIFAASTKTQIKEIPDEDLVKKTAQMFKYIAMDIGVIIPQDGTEWQYICTRLMNLLQKYYSALTLADVKLAFELATVGELDEFLPKDRNGRADKNHYQQFNIEFLAKILNAYRQKQNRTVSKAFAALPEPTAQVTPEQIQQSENSIMQKLALAFLQFKYTGQMPSINSIYEMLFFDHLTLSGLAERLVVTEADRKLALLQLQSPQMREKLNEFELYHINKQGTRHEKVETKAYWIARKRAFLETFKQMVADEIYIYHYTKTVRL